MPVSPKFCAISSFVAIDAHLPTDASSGMTIVEDAVQEDLVVIIHGIHTRARWQGQIRDTLEERGLIVELTNYGKLNFLQFLLPFFRRRAIASVKTQIKNAIAKHPKARLSIIAHSFGTYVISEIVKKDFTMRIRKLVL